MKAVSKSITLPHRPFFSICFASLVLGACGSTGGGGILDPAPTPNPDPTPSVTIKAPEAATFGNNIASPIATAAGPNFDNPASGITAFPLLQTIMAVDSPLGIATNAGPSTDLMRDGGFISLNGTTGSVRFTMNNSASGITDVDLKPVTGEEGYYEGIYGAGYALSFYIDSTAGTSDLTWMRYGSWRTKPHSTMHASFFVGGYQTPSAEVPTTGTATYSGTVNGAVAYPSSMSVTTADLEGVATLQANFATNAITGSLTSMQAGNQPWNDVSITATISGSDRGAFSGSTAVTSNPGHASSMGTNATGTINGRFYGPSAQEAGAVWTLHDGTKAAVGTIGARR